jgi:ferredoxin--NADP+ reductase
VAGWLKRGPTGVIGTNKSDGAQTAQAVLADLAGGPDVGEGDLPRPGLLRLPAVGADGVEAGFPLAAVLAERGVRAVSYEDWLRIEAAETELARSLGRGERVKLPSAEAVWGVLG